MVNIGYTRKACQNNNPNYAQVLLMQYTKGPVDYQVKEEYVQFAAVCLLVPPQGPLDHARGTYYKWFHRHDQAVPGGNLQEARRSKLHR
jgi:hypothetical protein